MNYAIRLFTFVIFAFGGLSTSIAQVCEQQTLAFSIYTDLYPQETTWNIVDSDGNIVLSGGPYNEPNTLYTTEACVPLGCYTLQLMDSFGDGLDGSSSSGIGVYSISMNGVVLQQCFPVFQNIYTFSFCGFADCENANLTVPGCTNSLASNFDSEATVDNGSCDMSFLCGPGTFFDEASGICLVDGEGGAPSCPSDLDGDGAVGIGDLLDLLGDYGTACD